jgi:hypothetical protein
MWTAVKVFFSGALKQVLATLIPWLKTEAARFISDMLPAAIDIVRGVARQDDLSNREKAELAAKRLAEAAKDAGLEAKERWLNQTVEIALEALKSNLKVE